MVIAVTLSSGAVKAQGNPAETPAELNRQLLELHSSGKYEQAILIAKKLFETDARERGPDHPDTATSLNNLGYLYQATGAYAKAEPLHQRALAIHEKALGPAHPDTAMSLNNLAALHHHMGAYGKAEPLMQRALAIRETALGPAHPDTAESLNNLALLYQTMGAYGQAEPLYQRALAIEEKALGPAHPDTAQSLNNLAALYHHMGAFGKAEPLYQRALAISEQAVGPAHPDTAQSLNNLAALYHHMGAFGKAEPLYQRALAISEQAVGPAHPDTATSLNSLAALYRAMGAYGKAEPLYQRALAITEKALGPAHPDTASSLNNLAMLYRDMGAYGKAEPLYQRALGIREKELGPAHPDTASSLNNLAELYHLMGAYAKAEPLYQRALAITEKALGPAHLSTATSLNNLAALYRAMGAYGKAEPLYHRALAISEKLGPTHPDTALTLNNLAMLYGVMGAYGKAEPLFQRALAISKQALGPAHANTATSLANLAALYEAMGAYGKAEPLVQDALAINEKALGLLHPNTAMSLNNLAEIYRAMGAYGKAEPLYHRALAISEKALGPAHANTATSLNNLAGLYEAMGAYGKAEPLHHRALAISEKALGPAHPDTAGSLNNLSGLFWAQGRWSEAQDVFRRGIQIDESNAQGILALGDESRKRAYIETLTGRTHAAVSFSLAARGKVADVDSLGLQVVLQRKGRVLDVLADTYASVRRSLSAQDRERFDQWRDTNARYAALFFRGLETMPAEKYRALLDELKSEIEALETQLSQRSAEFRTQAETVTMERVQRAIPADAALIEWFRYEPFNPKAKGQEPRWGTARYVAYVLKREGQPVPVDLGEAASIERILSNLLVTLRDPGSSLVGELAHKLDVQVMQPLRPHLGDARQILLSPDGMLNLLPFGVLVDEQEHYLAERLPITYLTSGRDLLRTPSTAQSRQAPIVIADPDFGLLDKTAAAPASENSSNDPAARPMKFEPLSGTAAEAQALKALLKLKDQQVLTKSKATEAALKQVKGPRLLHIATHGFVREDQPLSLPSLGIHRRRQDRLQAPKGENPLLRSGLALAGANGLRSGQDDGVLTALEVAGLDLVGTELAILSACETGLGAVQNGEGVYGLRRALVLAGVRTQITSLWRVEDTATKDLMIDYYRRLQAGAGRSQALRDAQLTMLRDPARAHPYYWASFIAIGEQKALDW